MKRSLIAPLAGPLVAAILLAAFPFAGAAQAKPGCRTEARRGIVTAVRASIDRLAVMFRTNSNSRAAIRISWPSRIPPESRHA